MGGALNEREMTRSRPESPLSDAVAASKEARPEMLRAREWRREWVREAAADVDGE